MSPAGGTLVLASTACAQIAREPRVRVPAVTPAGYGWPSHACGVVLGIRHRCWGVIAGPAHPAVDQPARRRYLGEDRRRTLLAGVVEDPGQELVAAKAHCGSPTTTAPASSENGSYGVYFGGTGVGCACICVDRSGYKRRLAARAQNA